MALADSSVIARLLNYTSKLAHHPPTQDAAGIASSLPKPKGNLVSPGIRLGMVPGYQKLGKLTGSPSGTTVVGLVPSQVVACLFI